MLQVMDTGTEGHDLIGRGKCHIDTKGRAPLPEDTGQEGS